MRLIEADLGEVRAVAVAPDDRFVAASGANGWCAVFDWASGATVRRYQLAAPCTQFAFGPNNWMAYVQRGALHFDRFDPGTLPKPIAGVFAGGAAVSPDRKVLAATRVGEGDQAELSLWALPEFRPLKGFAYWPPLRRLAFSPDGEFIAGIWGRGFELRFAVTGGLDHRHRLHDHRGFISPGFVSFSPDSGTCVYGWEDELYVFDLSTGTSKRVHQIVSRSRDTNLNVVQNGRLTTIKTKETESPFHDGAFTGSGNHFVTLEQPGRWKRWDEMTNQWRTNFDKGAASTGRLKLWNPESWEVTREYDWGCGPLTCLAFTADGSAGVCGTADGRLVQFDVDE